jgi:hypothetical protein
MKKWFAGLLMALAVALPVVPARAGDEAKTLTPEVCKLMKSGKKLDSVWLGPDYDKSKGFKVADLEYLAEERNGQVIEYLPAQLKTIAKADSPYTLTVTVVDVGSRTATGLFYIKGKITVEGRVTDSQGKVVAAFKTREKMPENLAGTDAKAGVDKIMTAIVKDLLR